MRIKELRRDRGVSQKDFAASMGVAQSIVSTWESEAALPRTRDLPQIAKVLHCDINDLFNCDHGEAEAISRELFDGLDEFA